MNNTDDLNDIALQLHYIDWEAVQCDDIHENDRLHMLKDRLREYNTDVVITLLLRLLEAEILTRDEPMIFADNSSSAFDFKKLCHYVDGTSTGAY